MISSGSEQPIGDSDLNSFIGGLQIHENLAGVQVAGNPYKIAVKAPRLRVHVIPSRATSNGASNPTRLVGAGPTTCTLGLSLILRLVRLGAGTLKG